ncbi:MAG: tRNA (adenosine(37)-N6)-threonylcarbamoyltransferase complex transferase subunit TsaD [Alphaproteobacteria bacterium]|nr:tRNA (adenosine(37)-N6)-threonylcarbamoyltransferase complex transferase subunit TsaD [Alphaproteobacteria bacterium]MCB9928254.1 tRNA (adenosine(37)-N6)-threonylcarbamoyltransferase complex transferase subunit TsaD [Alphaproteobacteria bacterium]
MLGIETSCDETAVAVVRGDRTILAQSIHSQLADHAPYGGVVPEIAARAHLQLLRPLVERTLAEAALPPADLAAVAATTGPGLIGGVMVGATLAKALAFAWGKPFVAVNHLEAHALSARLSDAVPFPYLLLLVSGGHCQLLAVADVGAYTVYGTTIDDALGEAFDKTARLLGLGYPGGPAVERLARRGDPARFALPRPLAGRPGCDFSFAGLKTAVRQAIQALPPGEAEDQTAADLCASFQAACADSLADRCRHAMDRFADEFGSCERLVVAGGVAANQALRHRLVAEAAARGATLIAPPPELCTDNAAMVAWAGWERFRRGQRDSLATAPRPRWPLDGADMALPAGL